MKLLKNVLSWLMITDRRTAVFRFRHSSEFFDKAERAYQVRLGAIKL
jgi:hypothetical protein